MSSPSKRSGDFHQGSSKKILKATSLNHTNTQRKIADVTKRLDNVEYMIKIEDKNKKQLIERYEKQIQKTEKVMEKLEEELKGVIKELNEKESKIYEIQKVKFDAFKEDISRYEEIYHHLEAKQKDLLIQTADSKLKAESQFNQAFMLLEEVLSTKNELSIGKRKIGELKESLDEIERSYPKEFEFLLEDIKLEKELIDIRQQKKQALIDIERNEKNKVVLKRDLDSKNLEKKGLDHEIAKINTSIESLKSYDHLNKLEEYIMKNVNDILTFDKFKSIVANYYNQKNFDLEHEINIRLLSNLNLRLTEMKGEFYELKEQKLNEKSKVEKQIEDLMKALKLAVNIGKNEKSKLENDVTSCQRELDRINSEINFLELSCKKKETLFTKYIVLLKNRCKKTKEESYYDMNPALVIEVDFEEKFRDELLKLIEEEKNFSQEDKIKNKNLVEIYLKELSNREKLLQNALTNRSKLLEDLEFLNHEIEKLQESYNTLDTDVITKKTLVTELNIKEKVMIERIEIRNMSLSSNLEKLGEMEFENYLKSNDSVLKNMKKIYGNKVLDKVFKQQKQKFLENVIMDHSQKKNKVNELISQINIQENIILGLNNKLITLEPETKQATKKYYDAVEYRDNKIKDGEVIEESRSELKLKIEEIVQQQFKDIESEKKQLEFKFNLSYYFEKIKELNARLDINLKSKQEMSEELHKFRNIIDEKEQKLYLEDMDLKSSLISIQSGVKDETGKAHLPFRTASIRGSQEKYILNEDGEKASAEEVQSNMEDIVAEKQQSLEENKNNTEDLVNLTNSVSNQEEGNVGTGTSYKSMIIKKDPLIMLSLEKIRPLSEGINIYKRYNNISLSKLKQYDPNAPDRNTPEACGYSMRNFKLNPAEELIEIKNQKTKIIEQKLLLNSIKSIMLSNAAKQIIKNKKNLTKKPNSEIEKLVQNEFIPFTILHTEGSMDVIAPNFAIFSTFQTALEELVKQKKIIIPFLKMN